MPPLNLTQQQEQYLRDNFQLSYHIPYLDVCSKKISLKDLDVLEIGGALPASLVIEHLECNSWSAVEAPSYDIELGEANQFHRNHKEQQKLIDLGHRYRHFYCNAEDLGDEHLNQYDLIFTIACFEHINRLPLAIEKMLQYLKPGGKLFTMHSPIWSAFDGHHLPIGIPERFDTQLPDSSYIFQPWGHLLQSRAATFTDIASRFDREFAEEVIYNTYNSNHINRYFSEDYWVVFEASGFLIEEYQITFPRNPSPEIQSALEGIYPGYKQFGNNGIYAILQKPSASVVTF
ncbi:methyltransferase domain-containing protein [Cyanobium sp. WAJ14-Wanaka]|uniref:methyltransferase domain-containing protein n=1 Tax=Cyanobium sp. WAJ14-Wanaka TaxID=2823725 RepID=UPI0020CE9608|nr:class I SAM-dependent methyltransferase [Cyanobium sp. WAJ14-Wanaka]MCP9775656.1 class I SAM-dependent methyltransferase [Cyanobium sp. WAJ14-Wanaka]